MPVLECNVRYNFKGKGQDTSQLVQGIGACTAGWMVLIVLLWCVSSAGGIALR